MFDNIKCCDNKMLRKRNAVNAFKSSAVKIIRSNAKICGNKINVARTKQMCGLYLANWSQFETIASRTNQTTYSLKNPSQDPCTKNCGVNAQACTIYLKLRVVTYLIKARVEIF